MNILFCGGGTAGHVTPNLALIDEICKLKQSGQCRNEKADGVFCNATIFYAGSTHSDAELLSPYIQSGKVEKYFRLDAPKLRRTFCLSNFALPFRFVKAVKQAGKILDEIKPQVIFSKGGYVGLPIVIAASRRKIPSILHESDLSMGLANRISMRYATRALSAFPQKNRNTTVVGMIVRQNLIDGDRQKGLDFCKFDGSKPLLLVTGGSLGAQALNEAIADTPSLADKFDIFVLTGKGKSIDCDFVHRAEFCNTPGDLFTAADVCLTRAGSTTLCELTLCKTPFVAVPLVKGSRGEQRLNAEYFAKRGCGMVLDESKLQSRLAGAVKFVYDNRAAFVAKQTKYARTLNGTQNCLDEIADLLKNVDLKRNKKSQKN